MPSPVSQRKKFVLLHALWARMLAKRMSGQQEVAQEGFLSFWRGFIQWKHPAAAPGAGWWSSTCPYCTLDMQ